MVSVSISKGNVRKLFPTPVISDELRDAETLNAELEKLILERRAGDEGHQLSNRGGWQSQHDLVRWGGDAAKQLIRHALELADSHTSGGEAGKTRWRCEAWANVSESGHFNMPHVHSATFWSAVYYVSVGDGQGGELVLHDPRMPGLIMHAPQLRDRGPGPDVAAKFEPEPGLMILFPGWLSHSVEPWQGTGQRISVAMNIRAAAQNNS